MSVLLLAPPGASGRARTQACTARPHHCLQVISSGCRSGLRSTFLVGCVLNLSCTGDTRWTGRLPPLCPPPAAPPPLPPPAPAPHRQPAERLPGEAKKRLAPPAQVGFPACIRLQLSACSDGGCCHRHLAPVPADVCESTCSLGTKAMLAGASAPCIADRNGPGKRADVTGPHGGRKCGQSAAALWSE